ncbi:MAG: hypothetical protein GX677_02150 [Treponema sp.]|nr:hypothetical protein [Treponema sp.]
MKKVVLGLVLIICISLLSPIYANNEKDCFVPNTNEISDFIYNGVLPIAKGNRLYKSKGELYLGTGIKIYQLMDDNLMDTETIVYPLYDTNGVMLGVVQQYYVNGHVLYSYEESNTEELTKIINGTEKILIIAIRDESVIFVGEKEFICLGLEKNINNSYLSTIVNEYGVKIGSKHYKLVNVSTTASSSYNTYPNSNQLDYCLVAQGSGHPFWCWAACAASVIRYKRNLLVSVSTIAGGYAAGSLALTNTKMTNYSVTTSGVVNVTNLSMNYIQSCIYTDYPIVSGFTETTGTQMDHMVVIIGYNVSGGTISIMDPWGDTPHIYYNSVYSYSPLTIHLTSFSGLTYTLQGYIVAYS